MRGRISDAPTLQANVTSRHVAVEGLLTHRKSEQQGCPQKHVVRRTVTATIPGSLFFSQLVTQHPQKDRSCARSQVLALPSPQPMPGAATQVPGLGSPHSALRCPWTGPRGSDFSRPHLSGTFSSASPLRHSPKGHG